MNLFSKHSIDRGVQTFRDTPGAVLIDVREPEEYAAGILKKLGFTNVRSIGGISRYKGDIERLED